LEKLDDDDHDDVDINRALETIKENLKVPATESVGFYEMKRHMPWVDEECSKLFDKKKQAKLQWLQNPSQQVEVI
jgi:hypothetical protein